MKKNLSIMLAIFGLVGMHPAPTLAAGMGGKTGTAVRMRQEKTVPAPSSKSVWKEKSLRIHLSSGVVPVIVVRPGFATDIEVDFPFRDIVRGNSSWSIGTDRTLEFRRENVRHIVVRVPKKRGETRYTNMVLIRIDGHPYSFTLKEASPSHPETFNTLVFVSER